MQNNRPRLARIRATRRSPGPWRSRAAFLGHMGSPRSKTFLEPRDHCSDRVLARRVASADREELLGELLRVLVGHRVDHVGPKPLTGLLYGLRRAAKGLAHPFPQGLPGVRLRQSSPLAEPGYGGLLLQDRHEHVQLVQADPAERPRGLFPLIKGRQNLAHRDQLIGRPPLDADGLFPEALLALVAPASRSRRLGPQLRVVLLMERHSELEVMVRQALAQAAQAVYPLCYRPRCNGLHCGLSPGLHCRLLSVEVFPGLAKPWRSSEGSARATDMCEPSKGAIAPVASRSCLKFDCRRQGRAIRRQQIVRNHGLGKYLEQK